MFYLFCIIDIIYILISILVYKHQLRNTQIDIENQIKINSEEVSFSLSKLIIQIINKIQLDLFQMYKHYDFYLKLNKTLNLTDCYFNQSLDENKNYLKLIKKNNSYPISIILENLTNYNIEDYLSELKLMNQLNQISYLGEDDLFNFKEERICFMIPILKSIIFREISKRKENSLLNNIFFLVNNFIFQYPPNNTSLSLLQTLENYSKKISICKFKYFGRCFFEELNEELIKQEKNISNSNVIHILNQDMKIFSCISIINENDFFICIQTLLYKKLNILKDFERKNNLLVLAKKNNSQILIYYSSNINKTEFNDIYSVNNSLLGNYSYSDNQILLFHILYYELFKYKPSFITKDLIDNLIIEYQMISNNIINNITENSSSLKPITLELTQTHIEVNYDISGLLDYNNGNIKNTKVFIQITPILIQNIDYNDNLIFTYNSNKSDLFCYELNIFRFSTKAFDGRVFDIFLFKSARSFYIFAFILYFFTSLNSTLFTKFLDCIFYPIILLTKHLKQKILLKDNFQNELEEQNKKRKEEEVINSPCPEMQNLIQLCKFLENILDMKKIIQTKEQIEIDFSLMNEIYSELTTNKEIINYGHFVSNFYFQKEKYEECSNSIKIIEDILDSEKKRIKNESENIEIEILNILTNISYANEFRKSNEIFQSNNITNQKYYYDLLIISEKLYFMFAICLFFKAKKIKKELKALIGNDKSSKKTKIKKNIPLNKKIRDNNFLLKKNNLNFQKTIDSKEGEIIENQKELLLNYSKAGKYFKKSLDINKKFGINKIKSIVILIYLSKCYMYKNLFKKSDSIDSIKNSIISLFNLNQYFIEMKNKIHLSPRIMLLINGIIFEQIIFNIAKINKNYNNEKLASQIFLKTLSLSYFKTDNIQSKSCKNLGNLIKYSLNKKYRNLIQYLHKIQFRLNSKIIKYQNQNENISKNIFLLFSNKLIDIIPTKIELCEVISNCIKNYLNKNDNVWCNTFNLFKEYSSKKAKEVSKDFLIRILSQNNKLNEEKYGMQKSIFKINEIIENLLEDKKNIMINFNILNSDNKNIIPEDENVIFDDNYIFQFILLKDYIFDSTESKNKFKKCLIQNNVSLYTFVFDEDYKINPFQKSKFNRIIHNLKYIPEGVLIYVDNFFSIKSAFQNISRSYFKKNVFNINCELSKNIFLDYYYENK